MHTSSRPCGAMPLEKNPKSWPHADYYIPPIARGLKTRSREPRGQVLESLQARVKSKCGNFRKLNFGKRGVRPHTLAPFLITGDRHGHVCPKPSDSACLAAISGPSGSEFLQLSHLIACKCHPCVVYRNDGYARMSKQIYIGLLRELNPGPLAPEARIIPLDQAAMFASNICEFRKHWAISFFSPTALSSPDNTTNKLVGRTRDTMQTIHFFCGDGRSGALLARCRSHWTAWGDRRALSPFFLSQA